MFGSVRKGGRYKTAGKEEDVMSWRRRKATEKVRLTYIYIDTIYHTTRWTDIIVIIFTPRYIVLCKRGKTYVPVIEPERKDAGLSVFVVEAGVAERVQQVELGSVALHGRALETDGCYYCEFVT